MTLIAKTVTWLIAFLICLLMASGFAAPLASAHGGGLDSDGGHNCYVGSCAGSYHCHQARGPRCGGGWSGGGSPGGNSSGGSSQSNRPSSWSIARCVDADGTLTRGEVGKIQASLKGFGFSPGTIDGKYGPRTRSALNAFEDRAGISRSFGSAVNGLSIVYLWAAC